MLIGGTETVSLAPQIAEFALKTKSDDLRCRTGFAAWLNNSGRYRDLLDTPTQGPAHGSCTRGCHSIAERLARLSSDRTSRNIVEMFRQSRILPSLSIRLVFLGRWACILQVSLILMIVTWSVFSRDVLRICTLQNHSPSKGRTFSRKISCHGEWFKGAHPFLSNSVRRSANSSSEIRMFAVHSFR